MSQIVVLYDLTAGETSYNTKESSKQAPLRDPPGFISEHSAVQTVHDAESQYNRPAKGGPGPDATDMSRQIGNYGNRFKGREEYPTGRLE